MTRQIAQIAVDLDGVLWNLMAKYVEVHNELYKDTKTINDVSDWEFFDLWKMYNEDRCYEIFHMIDLMDVPIIDEKAPQHMKALQKYGEVDILTARRPESRQATIEKLESMKIFKGEHYDSLMIVGYKPYGVKTDYPYDYFIDDSPRIATALHEKYNGDIHAPMLFLWDQPWNQKIGDTLITKRVNGWKTILDWFKVFQNL
jgi:uncharacterized HAD superfamily protein